jgi:hypothetical protein
MFKLTDSPCFLSLKKNHRFWQLTLSRETLVEEAMTYAGLTLFNDTPLTAYGQVDKRFSDASDLRQQIFPLCFPERWNTMMIKIIIIINKNIIHENLVLDLIKYLFRYI